MNFENNNLTRMQQDISVATSELTQLEAIKILLGNNDLACEINIAGMSIGVCNNSMLLPVIEHQEKEIVKFLNNEANEWE